MRVGLLAVLAVVVAGCGPGTGPELKPAKPINISCMERVARSSPLVASVDTRVPRLGPGAGARRYIAVQFKVRETRVVVGEWASERAAAKASGEFPSRDSIGIEANTVEAFTFRRAEEPFALFAKCGLGAEPEPSR